MESRLKQGKLPVSPQDWKDIEFALTESLKQPKSYCLSPITGCIDIDPNKNLLNEPHIDDVEMKIKKFNTCITQLQTICDHLIRKMNTSTDTNEILTCMKTIQTINTRTDSHNRCSFTGEERTTNMAIQLIYKVVLSEEDNNNMMIINTTPYQQSRIFCVCERIYTWLQSIYTLKKFTEELTIRITSQQANNTKFFDTMNASIQFAWEFVYPKMSSSSYSNVNQDQ
jgi:hypothetical protein